MSFQRLYPILIAGCALVVLASIILALREPVLAQHPPCEVQARQPLPQPIGESPEPPVAVPPLEADDLTPSERRFLGRIKGWVEDRADQRVNAKVEEAFVDAASEKRGGLGSIIAAACLTLVKKLVAGLIVAAVVSVLLGYWWILAVLLLLVAAVGYVAGSIGGRRAVKG